MGGVRRPRPAARRRQAASPSAQEAIRELVDRWIETFEVPDDLDAARQRRVVLEGLIDTAHGIDRLLGLERRATARRTSAGTWRMLRTGDARAIEDCIARLREVVIRFEHGIRDKQRRRRALRRLDELEASLPGGKPGRAQRRRGRARPTSGKT